MADKVATLGDPITARAPPTAPALSHAQETPGPRPSFGESTSGVSRACCGLRGGGADGALFPQKLLLDIVIYGLGEVVLRSSDSVPLFEYVELDKT